MPYARLRGLRTHNFFLVITTTASNGCWDRVKEKHVDATRCNQGPENIHPKGAKVTDDYAVQLTQLLQPGVTKILSETPSAGKQRRAWHAATSPPAQLIEKRAKTSGEMKQTVRKEGSLGLSILLGEVEKPTVAKGRRSASPKYVIP